MRVIFLASLLVVWVWAGPNVDKFAQIIVNEGGSGYVDSEGKLWVLGTRWKTKKIEQREGPFYIIKDGKIDTIPARPGRSWQQRLYPYLYFWLYDSSGNKIKEGVIHDSVGGEGGIYFVPLKTGGGLIAARVTYDLLGTPDPTRGYVILILMDKKGEVKQIHKFLQSDYLYSLPDTLLLDYNGNVYLFLGGIRNLTTIYLVIGEDNFRIMDLPQSPPLPSGVRYTVITEFLKGNIPFYCQLVDTFRMIGKRGDMRARKEDERIFPDSIQILNYDVNIQQWLLRRYHLPSASFRKFENFHLYPLESYGRWIENELHWIPDKPAYESVRLKNNYIIVVVFMKENDSPVAYQMLFDSLGNYIKPVKTETLKPKDIKEIPAGSKMFIRSVPAGYTESGKSKGVDVYIWGYGLDDGMLYWRKYHID